jgi:HlyD family secretion protein
MNRLIFILFAVFLLSGCGSKNGKIANMATDNAASFSPDQITKVVGIGKVEPEGEIVQLASPTGGIVSELYRNEGDNVKAGERLLRLDDELDRIHAAQLRSQVATQKAQLESDRIALETAVNKLDNRKRFLESTKALVERGAETSQNLDDIRTDVRNLELAVQSARAGVSMSESRLHDLEAQLLYSEAEVTKKTIKAPSDGMILSISARKGSAVGALSSFADFAPSGRKIIRAEVDELYAVRLADGLPVNIRNVGSDSTLATGKIIFLSPYLKLKSLFAGSANEQEDRLVRDVKISIEDSKEIILNSKVECVILLNRKQ